MKLPIDWHYINGEWTNVITCKDKRGRIQTYVNGLPQIKYDDIEEEFKKLNEKRKKLINELDDVIREMGEILPRVFRSRIRKPY